MLSRHWYRGSAAPRPSAADLERRRALREKRRELLVAKVVNRLDDGVTHECVAEETGLPVGYLWWKYPTVADLQAERGTVA